MQKLALAAALFVALLNPNPAQADEPTVDEVRDAAIRYAGLRGRADRWSTRARLRHLLPTISATVGQVEQRDVNVQFDERLAHDSDEALIYDSARNQNEDNRRVRTDFTLRASVDVARLVFDSDELAASREARSRHEARLALIERVHTAYFERLLALDELRAVPRTQQRKRRSKALRVSMLEARLDGLTGGWYAARLRGAP